MLFRSRRAIVFAKAIPKRMNQELIDSTPPSNHMTKNELVFLSSNQRKKQNFKA
jgi:hypothetical protein